jgi:hypothetical protein
MASKGSPRTLDKMKNKAEIGEGLKQKRKSREDARPYKLMRKNVRQLALTSLKNSRSSHFFQTTQGI